ncbi:putative Late embryogenesis abundant protein, LEA-14 [Medicago truncatula]|nr:putative Late embryogenesis abundant protein, LEA-14 [Medicago truncatula]
MNMEHPPTRNIPTRSSDIGFVRRLTLTVVTIFVIFMAIIGIAWFVMHPHDPSFTVTSLSVSNFTVSDSQLTGVFEAGLTITNKNKKIQLILDNFGVVILYGETVLSEAEVQQPILLVKMSNKSMKVDLVTTNSAKFVHKVVQENLVEEWNKGVVNFDVKMVVRVGFEAGIWPSKEKTLCVSCGDLDVEFYSTKDTGKLLGIGKNCNIVEAKP